MASETPIKTLKPMGPGSLDTGKREQTGSRLTPGLSVEEEILELFLLGL
jgi:hypothetical protein